VNNQKGTGSFLEVRDLRVAFPTDDGLVRAVDGLSFRLDRGRCLGIVGESGSGKSATALALMGLHQGGRLTGAQLTGEVWLDGQELIGAPAEAVRRMRGARMAMIFQDPLTSLNPFHTVGAQIGEAYRVHHRVSRSAARRRAVDLLGRVGIAEPERRVDDHPHQFSGGMRQRVMIAMALSCDPALLIADEPTTALDVTVQAQILDLIRDLQAEFDTALILVTHDLGVVAEMAHDVLVMYAGRCVEQAPAEDLFARPEHPYTWGLLGSIPRLDRPSHERLQPVSGAPPSLINVPPGCAFHPRCPYEADAGAPAREDRPALRETAAGHLVACHLAPARRRELWAARTGGGL
jgi:peptide/nickel transport system ATP-binding protein